MTTVSACGTSVTVDPGFSILDTSPSGGAVNVDIQVELFVVFSQEVDAATLTSFAVADAGGAAVEAAATLLSDKRVVSVIPTAPLTADTAYVLTIAGTLKSSSGETLDATIEKRFRTAP
jgi:hypothetical protein